MKIGAKSLLAALAAAVALACGDAGAPERAPFRAVWVASDSAALGRAEAARLTAAGVTELFVEAGRLGWDGERARIEAGTILPLPREMPVTLVITGGWSAAAESPRDLAAAWGERLDTLARTARESGAVPVGVHFDLAVAGDPDRLAATLGRLRRELRGRLYVSAALDLDAVDDASARELGESVDFLVAEVYGQSPAPADDPARWDLDATRRRLARLDRLGVPYVALGWTLGRASIERRGAATPIRPALPLPALLRSPRLVVVPGAVFEGVDRQVFALSAREPLTVGSWTLARGETVRVARPTTDDLEKLLDTLGEPGAGERLGLVLRALPPAGDSISPTAANLAAAFEPGAAAPDLAVTLVDAGELRGRTRLRVRLSNASAESTELGGGEWNWVQLEFAGSALGSVEAGDFAGWEQLWRGRERRTLRALRQADTLRLFAPFVGAGETLESGVVELRSRGTGRPAVRTSGRFLLPGGREYLVPSAPAAWTGAEPDRRPE